MVEIDPTGFIITIAVGVGVPLLLFSMKGFKSTSESTLTGAIRLEGLKTNVDDVKLEMNKGFDRMEAILNRRDEDVRKSLADVTHKIEELTRKSALLEYRLKSLERTRISYSNGEGDKDNDYNNTV